MRILDRIKTAEERTRETSHLNAFARDPSLPLYGLQRTIEDIFQFGDYPNKAGTRAVVSQLGEGGLQWRHGAPRGCCVSAK
jgi:hypothetical protein